MTHHLRHCPTCNYAHGTYTYSMYAISPASFNLICTVMNQKSNVSLSCEASCWKTISPLSGAVSSRYALMYHARKSVTGTSCMSASVMLPSIMAEKSAASGNVTVCPSSAYAPVSQSSSVTTRSKRPVTAVTWWFSSSCHLTISNRS